MNFPFVKQTGRGTGLEFAARMKSGTFLVVDDFDSMRKVTVNQLKQLGAVKMVEASNGAEALRVMARMPITMVLSDWNMPVMTGLELLLNLRTSEQFCRIPFLMITAEAERDRVTAAIQGGVSELLVKPYTAARLAERIEKALDWKPRVSGPLNAAVAMAGTGYAIKGAAPTTAPAPALAESAVPPAPTSQPSAAPAAVPVPAASAEPAPAKKAERPTILVVDDTPDNLHLLAGIFKDDYRVRIAHNGAKALSICHSDNPPDLVLLDVMMPDMDGFEVARRMREHPSSEHVPVIFVTALTDEASRLKGMELGAVDFVTKPIDPVALKVRVQNFMRYIELHAQLQDDYDEMMANARLRDDVERMTRHDIKAPLAGVLGLIQSMTDAANLTDDQREMLRMAEEAALQTLNMINLSNELYKIETGRYQLKPQTVPVAQIVRRIAELQRKAFAVKNLTIAVAVPHGVGDDTLVALGDPMLCYSLFQNLLKNSCEAAPEGTAVTATIYPSAEAKPLRIAIDNKGAVPVSIRETFWEKYATAGKQEGTGIGTYSARLLTEAQNGTISMETSDETGSTRIVVSLPA
jgi:two-component system sensor histidine kinase/response regulator